MASFQNAIFLCRSGVPAPSSIRFSLLLRASGSSSPSGPQDTENRIVPQLLAIVEVFVSQRQPVDPLREHLQKRVLRPLRIPAVEKTIRQPRQQIQATVGLARQNRTIWHKRKPSFLL